MIFDKVTYLLHCPYLSSAFLIAHQQPHQHMFSTFLHIMHRVKQKERRKDKKLTYLMYSAIKYEKGAVNQGNCKNDSSHSRPALIAAQQAQLFWQALDRLL
jgi:hypothetical protein